MNKRTATIKRKTKETDISVTLNIDGNGLYDIHTSIPFFDHMLSSFSKHSDIDLKIHATGDTNIDDHHTVEDVGICLGSALKKALKETYERLIRFGHFSLAMEEALVDTALDISGRPFLVYHIQTTPPYIKNFSLDLLEEFWRALCIHMGLNLHIHMRCGKNNHHICEASFKSVARALKRAILIDPRLKKNDSSSTKGSLEY